MNSRILAQYRTGRFFLAELPRGQDLIQGIEALCGELSVDMALFSVVGLVSAATMGVYDQNQQVFVTSREESALEIVSCRGTANRSGNPAIDARIILADEHGKLVGGRLFSETCLFVGEITLQELIGPPLKRERDAVTSLNHWITQP